MTRSSSVREYARILSILALTLMSLTAGRSVLAGATFVWDPTAIGLPGSAFSGQAIEGGEWSHIVFGVPPSWEEHGFLQITGVTSNGQSVTPDGLNSTYSLYWEFFLTGESATNQILSADMVLYGLGGVASFGHDTNNDAFVDTGAATPIALSLHSLIRGMVGQTAAALFADLDTTFEPTAAGGSFFLEPEIVHRMHGDFFHPFAFGGVIPVADGFKIVGGDDRISLIPAPATSALILSMLPGLVALIGRATGRRDRC